MSGWITLIIVSVVVTSGLLAAIAILQNHRKLPVAITAVGVLRCVAVAAVTLFVLGALPAPWKTPAWPVIYVPCIQFFLWPGWITSLQLALISTGVMGIVFIAIGVTLEIARAVWPG